MTVTVLEHLTKVDPTNETAYARLLSLHARNRSPAAISRTWAQLEAALTAVGLSPTLELTELHERLAAARP